MDNRSSSHSMEMPVSYSIYTEVQKKGIVWKVEK